MTLRHHCEDIPETSKRSYKINPCVPGLFPCRLVDLDGLADQDLTNWHIACELKNHNVWKMMFAKVGYSYFRTGVTFPVHNIRTWFSRMSVLAFSPGICYPVMHCGVALMYSSYKRDKIVLCRKLQTWSFRTIIVSYLNESAMLK